MRRPKRSRIEVESYAEWDKDKLAPLASSLHQHVDICVRPNGFETSRSVYASTPLPLVQHSDSGPDDSATPTADPPDADIVMDVSMAHALRKRLAGVGIYFVRAYSVSYLG